MTAVAVGDAADVEVGQDQSTLVGNVSMKVSMAALRALTLGNTASDSNVLEAKVPSILRPEKMRLSLRR